MGTVTYTGYFGFVQDGGNRAFNITNIGNDEVTITFSGNLTLEAGDTDTYITVTDVNGVVLVDNQLISLVEFGETGEMADGISGYAYTVVTIGSAEYIFLDDVTDPTGLPTNPFGAGRNPLDPSPSTDPHPICFVTGTRIRTPDGERLVEDLRVGDAVITRDNGVQVILWTGVSEYAGLKAQRYAPVRIAAGALGENLPARDLYVSPQHRVVVQDWRAEVLFGQAEVLVAAKHLVNDFSIRPANDMARFSYHHIMFENHETVFSENLPTESFFPGKVALATLCEAARDAFFTAFPRLAGEVSAYGSTNRLALRAFEARAMEQISS